ncbi:MAG: hypothetical protein ACRED9_13175 [Caulobacteraceae bacterium]
MTSPNDPSASQIADQFHAAVTEHGPLEKTDYYRLQKMCLRCAATAEALPRVVLIDAARLAEMLARELDDDAVDAENLLLWKRGASEMEAVVRLASADREALDVLEELKTRAAVIESIRSGV